MKRVLVVEDDVDLCDTLVLLMESLGTECLKATSFEEVKNLSLKDLDTAVLDVNLGADKPSGIDVYRYLRERLGELHAIFLTGHAASHPLVQEVAKMSDVTVMAKPVDIDEFSRALLEP